MSADKPPVVHTRITGLSLDGSLRYPVRLSIAESIHNGHTRYVQVEPVVAQAFIDEMRGESTQESNGKGGILFQGLKAYTDGQIKTRQPWCVHVSIAPSDAKVWPPTVGTKIRVPFGDETRLFHVRGQVDNCIVLREWWPTKRRWNYSVEGVYYFQARGWTIPTEAYAAVSD